MNLFNKETECKKFGSKENSMGNSCYGKIESPYYFYRKNNPGNVTTENHFSNISERLDTSAIRDNSAITNDKNYSPHLRFKTSYQNATSKNGSKDKPQTKVSVKGSQPSKRNLLEDSNFMLNNDMSEISKNPLDGQESNSVNIQIDQSQSKSI